MDTIPKHETRDGHGCGDRDKEYAWDCPRSRLRPFENMRLLLLRGLVMDARHGERGGPGDGDLGYTEQTESGLYIPATVVPPVMLSDIESESDGG